MPILDPRLACKHEGMNQKVGMGVSAAHVQACAGIASNQDSSTYEEIGLKRGDDAYHGCLQGLFVLAQFARPRLYFRRIDDSPTCTWCI